MVRRSDHRYSKTAIAVILSLMLGRLTPAQAQSAKPEKRVFTLEQAVDFALKNYPAVRASLERVRAAEAGVGLARTNYLPRADVLWQANRATDNNITGLLLPQSIIPPITGPVTLSPSNQSAWGSAAGLLFSWEPIDFGYRGAKVDAARATQSRASAEVSLTRLDVSVATINAGRCRLRASTSQPGKSAAAGGDQPRPFGGHPRYRGFPGRDSRKRSARRHAGFLARSGSRIGKPGCEGAASARG